MNSNYRPKHFDEHFFWTVSDLYDYAEYNGLLDAPLFVENVSLKEKDQGPNGINLFGMSRPFIHSKNEGIKPYMQPDDYELLSDDEDYIVIK